MDQSDSLVTHQFSDSVSAMKYSPENGIYQSSSPYLAVASWDGNVVVYQTKDTGTNMASKPILQTNVGCPILGLCWQLEIQAVLLACADNNIRRWDLAGNSLTTIGQHTQPVKEVCCVHIGQESIVISGGWDSRVNFYVWHSGHTQLKLIGSSYLGKPVQQMSCAFPLLVTAHSEKLLHCWDLNNVIYGSFDPVSLMQSSLTHETTTIECFSGGKGVLIGSIEGRCAVKFIDLKTLKGDQRDFCFRCHRTDPVQSSTGYAQGTPKLTQIYAINGFAFNKKHGTFMSFGQDGQYMLWDHLNKTRLKTSKQAPWPLTAATMSDDGSQLALAYGYDWGKGAEESKNQYPINIIIRKNQLVDVQRKYK